MFGTFGTVAPGDLARIIQTALTPVFLLASIATLLNVFSTRLGRVADQVDALAEKVEQAGQAKAGQLFLRLAYLRRRSLLLDAAVVLATTGGGFIGISVLALFVGALRDVATAWILYACFGIAVLCTIAALGAFLTEALMAGRGVRIEVADQQREAARK